ncbi:hypothetical protein FJU11_01835 [Pararhizobium mangrovi]|uniref:Uncharacterized protein n=1 Tax=Pararhizobium mangrovi TaxID=2590452 RepID=A0A506UCC6_9HYPH|nr:hypothetical protein FJU11_01835 [Pararhizobium mangrovi]
MSAKRFAAVGLCAAGLLAQGHGTPAHAAGTHDTDAAFFDAVAGTWTGPGRIVAGKYKGTRFTCSLDGDTLADGRTGIAMGGKCRVGLFDQDMKAVIIHGSNGYEGQFMGGGGDDGLDVISGRVEPEKVVVGINRRDLYGAMVASLKGPDTLNVTVSVKVGQQMVPVIGMTLKRIGASPALANR